MIKKLCLKHILYLKLYYMQKYIEMSEKNRKKKIDMSEASQTKYLKRG